MIKSEKIFGIVVCSFEKSTKFNAIIAEAVKKDVGSHFDKPGTRLIFDLENVAFIDSSGFGALLSIMKNARRNDGVFRICSLSKEVLSLFRLLQLHNVFEIHDNREECLKSFSS
jgi:anti-sigma B factor antagonist